MQAYYPERFEREMGFTLQDWLANLPAACGGPLQQSADGQATCAIGQGVLHISWAVMPPRAIALVRFPRMAVSFEFAGVAEQDRQSFMRHFDRVMQRGGG